MGEEREGGITPTTISTESKSKTRLKSWDTVDGVFGLREKRLRRKIIVSVNTKLSRAEGREGKGTGTFKKSPWNFPPLLITFVPPKII